MDSISILLSLFINFKRTKERDAAIIYVGEDLDIILALCDRVLVLADGEVAGILDCRKTNKLEVGLLMTKKNDDRRRIEVNNENSLVKTIYSYFSP